MHEKHEIEQYFFDASTLDHLAGFASHFPNPCCLCTPSLGAELERRKVAATTLDVDTRFSSLEGFQLYDLEKPVPLGTKFGIIICDPPFLSISLPQLFEVISLLSLSNYSQPLLINYLASRATAITHTFAPFALRPTGYKPGYSTIQNMGRNTMEFFGNVGPEHTLRPTPLVIG